MRRLQRARLWGVWALRDARRRVLQVVSIALLLALGVGMYTALSSMAAWRTRSADASFAALRMHDLRISLVAGSYAEQGALRRAALGIPAHDSLVGVTERLVVPTQIDASTPGRTILVSGRLVGARVSPSTDRLAVSAGRPLAAGDSGRQRAELEQAFARHYDLPAAGQIRVAGGQVIRYVGQAQEPEYFVVTAPGADFGAEASFAVIFAPLPTVQALAGLPHQVNELVLRLRPGVSLATVQRQLTIAAGRALPDAGFTVTRGANEPAHRMLYKDAQGDQEMMDVFAVLLLAAATFAAFNLVSRTIEAQRREIGIGMALGVPPRTLARRSFLLGGQVAVLGVALGIPVGLTASAWLRSVIETFFPLPVVQTPFAWTTFMEGAALGLALPLIATAIPVWRAVRVRPIEAIRVGERAAGRSGLAGLARHLRLPGGSLANLPLRNVLRTPRRTLMTVLGITGVVTILVTLAGTLDSFNATIDASRRAALAGAPHRLTVDLTTPRPATDPTLTTVAGAATVGRSQASLRVPVTLRTGAGQLEAQLETVSASTPIWRPALEAGTLPPDRPGVAIAARAASDLNVRIGDTIAVRHPVPSARGFELVWTRLPVTAIHTSPFRFLAYNNDSAARQMRLFGLMNRLSVTPKPGASSAQVKRELLAIPGIAAVQGASELVDAVDEEMQQFNEVLLVTVAIAIAMALLIAYNTSAINTDERAREHATMFAYGVQTRRVLVAGITEAAMIGALATLTGIAAGRALLHWIVTNLMVETMPDFGSLTQVRSTTYALAVIAGLVVVSLAPLATARRLRRTNIPATLRVVE